MAFGIGEKNVIYCGVATLAGRPSLRTDNHMFGREFMEALANEIEVAFFALQSYVFLY